MALQFSPSAPTVAFAKTDQSTDRPANSNRLDLPNRTDEFKIHRSRIESPFHEKFQLCLTGRRVSRSPQGHRFHPLVRPPQAVATSVAHLPTRSHDRLRSGERIIVQRPGPRLNNL
jgi:hypothetical protein